MSLSRPISLSNRLELLRQTRAVFRQLPSFRSFHTTPFLLHGLHDKTSGQNQPEKQKYNEPKIPTQTTQNPPPRDEHSHNPSRSIHEHSHAEHDHDHAHSHNTLFSLLSHSHGKSTHVHVKTEEEIQQEKLAGVPAAKEAPMFSAELQKKEMRITKLGLYSNIVLTIVKGVAGVLGNSVALIADALHSVSDMVSDGATIFTIRHASAPADTDHPYGHGRIEDIGTLAVSSIVVVTGLGIGWHSIQNISDLILVTYPNLAVDISQTISHLPSFLQDILAATHGHSGHAGHTHAIEVDEKGVPTMLALSVAVGSVLIKELLFRMTMSVAKETNSRIVEINAWHHRSDALSSLIAVVGVAGAMVSLPVLDPLAGLFVAGLITKQGAEMAVEVFHDITDKQLPDELLSSLEESALSCRPYGVLRLGSIRGRKMGRYMIVDATIVVPQTFSVSAAHQASEAVRTKILEKHSGIAEVNIHVDVDGDCCSTAHSSSIYIPHPSSSSNVSEHEISAVGEQVNPEVSFQSHQNPQTQQTPYNNPAEISELRTASTGSHSASQADQTHPNEHPEHHNNSVVPGHIHTNFRLMRPHGEVEHDVRQAIANMPLSPELHQAISVSHIICHYVHEKLTVSLNIGLDATSSMIQNLSLVDLKALGEEIEHTVVREIDDIMAARVCLLLAEDNRIPKTKSRTDSSLKVPLSTSTMAL